MNELETKVKISADTAGVKSAGAAIRASFDPKSVKQFNQAATDLGKTYVDLIKKQTELTKQFANLEKGTAQYKKMKTEIQGVNTQLDLTLRTLDQLDRLQKRTTVTAQQGMGRNFLAGLAQGSGLGQYIPTDPGMGARMAGMAIAGGARRGLGIAAAPFTTPGVAGVAQGLSGIPIIGGFMGGALQTAAGTYESAVAYDRAQMQNMQFRNDRFGVVSTRDNPAYLANQALVAAAEARHVDAIKRQTQYATGSGVSMLRALTREGLAETPFFPGAEKETARNVENARLRLASRLPGGQEANLAAMYTADQLKKAYSDTASAELDIRKAKKELGKTPKTVTGTETGLSDLSMGIRYGLSPMELKAAENKFFSASGGSYSQTALMEALSARNAYGISEQLSGAFARGGELGGGATPGGSLATTLQTAVVMGMRGTKISEYLSTLVGLQRNAEQRGIKINGEEFNRMSMTMSLSGFDKLQASRVTGGLIQAGQQVSTGGVQSPLDLIMLKAAGFRPGNVESYFRAKRQLEDPTKYLPTVIDQLVKGVGGGPEQQAGMLKSAFGRYGVQIGAEQAMRLIDARRSGRSISELLKRREGLGGAAGMDALGADVLKIGGSTLSESAALAAKQTAMGYESAKWVPKFSRAALTGAEAMENFSGDLQKLAGVVQKVMERFKKMTSGGLLGFAGNALGMIGEVFGEGL